MSIKTVVKNILPYYIVKSVQARKYKKIDSAPNVLREAEAQENALPVEFTEDEKSLINYVCENRLSLVARERLFATLLSCKYVLENHIEGDFVECGVWRGGNSIIAAGVFKLYNSRKKVYMYDTFEGMTAPTEADIKLQGDHSTAKAIYEDELNKKGSWLYASLDDVKTNFKNFDLLSDNLEFIQGDVHQTLDKIIPDKISVLRLDTDWYESTKKEMNVLYPRVVQNGIFMTDDYGHWAGSKKAVDEYFRENNNRPFLQYIDYAARLGIKTK
jgi:hypothetical protein